MEKARKKIYVGKEPDTPIGSVWVALSDRGLVAVELNDEPEFLVKLLPKLGFQEVVSDREKTSAALKQIREYLLGTRRKFEIPIDADTVPGEGSAGDV